MTSSLTHFLTPNPQLALCSDGMLVSVVPGTPSLREATPAEFHAAADLALARGVHILTDSGGGGDSSFLWEGMSPEFRGVISGIGMAISAVVPIVGFISAAITAMELLGLTGSKYQPIFERIDALNVKLDQILAELSGTQKLVYSSWASNHWRDISKLLGQTSAALGAAFEVVKFQEDPTSPAAVQKLAIADNDSRVVVATLIAGGLDGGFWRRPHFGPAMNMAAWEFKTDARPDVTGDDRVWDYRIALPTLLLAIAARIIVIKAMHPPAQAHARLCSEVRTWTSFIGPLIQRIQNNVQRKTDFSSSEKSNPCAGAPTSGFFAGAVDLSIGLDDFIHLDAFGNVALDTYLRKVGRRPDFPGATGTDRGNLCYGGWVNVQDFSDQITEQDVNEGKFFLKHSAVLEKQGRFAENRLLWKTPILDLCDFNGVLWELCPKRPPLVDRVSAVLVPRRALAAAVAGTSGAKHVAREAYALAAMAAAQHDTKSETLLAGAKLTAVMLDETRGPAFRTSLQDSLPALVGKAVAQGSQPEAVTDYMDRRSATRSTAKSEPDAPA